MIQLTISEGLVSGFLIFSKEEHYRSYDMLKLPYEKEAPNGTEKNTISIKKLDTIVYSIKVF